MFSLLLPVCGRRREIEMHDEYMKYAWHAVPLLKADEAMR